MKTQAVSSPHRCNLLKLFLVPFSVMLTVNPALAQPLSYAEQLMERYAQIHLEQTTDEEQEMPMAKLLQEAEAYRDINPDQAEAWLALGRIKFGYGNTQGILTAPRIFKAARDDLLHAIELDKQAMQGLAPAFLGYLYVGLPPWPLSFGNKRKGFTYLDEAIAINSENLANNYFYAYKPIVENNFDLAAKQLEIAKASAESEPRLPYLQTLYLQLIEDLLKDVVEHR